MRSIQNSMIKSHLVLLLLPLPSIGRVMAGDHGLVGRTVLLLLPLHLVAIDRGRYRRTGAVMRLVEGDDAATAAAVAAVAGRLLRGEREIESLPDLGHVPFGRHGHLPDGRGHTRASTSCIGTSRSQGPGGEQGIAARFRPGLVEGEGMVGQAPAGAGAAGAEGGGDALVRPVGGRRGGREADRHGAVTVAPDGRAPRAAGRIGSMIQRVAAGRCGGHHLRRCAGRRRLRCARRTDEARFQQLHPLFEFGAPGSSWAFGRGPPSRPALLGAHAYAFRFEFWVLNLSWTLAQDVLRTKDGAEQQDTTAVAPIKPTHAFCHNYEI